jgi:preprotein translocase subunit SecB
VNNDDLQDQAANPMPATQFIIEKIYLKDVSFESPKSPLVFKSQWKPEIHLELNNSSQIIQDDLYEVVLSITVTAKNPDADKALQVAFVVELKQAGLFVIKSPQPNQLPLLIGSYCPTILYPYAREAVSYLVSQGGFPQLLLAPVNFDALFADAMRAKQQEQSGVSTPA